MSKIELIADYLDDERLIYIATATRDGELLEDVYEYWAVLADWQAGNRERALRRSNLAEASEPRKPRSCWKYSRRAGKSYYFKEE